MRRQANEAAFQDWVTRARKVYYIVLEDDMNTFNASVLTSRFHDTNSQCSATLICFVHFLVLNEFSFGWDKRL